MQTCILMLNSKICSMRFILILALLQAFDLGFWTDHILLEVCLEKLLNVLEAYLFLSRIPKPA